MFFGNQPPAPKRGLFGFMPGQNNMLQSVQQPMQQPVQQAPVAQMEAKPKHNWGHIIADTLLGLGGQQGVFGPMAEQKRLMAEKMQMQQQMRQAEMQDKIGFYDYQRAHPSAQPHYWEANDGSLHMVGPDGKPQTVYADPTPKYNWIPDGMGGGRYEAIPGTGGAPQYPAKPVGKLTPIAGDAGGNASGGFPRF